MTKTIVFVALVLALVICNVFAGQSLSAESRDFAATAAVVEEVAALSGDDATQEEMETQFFVTRRGLVMYKESIPEDGIVQESETCYVSCQVCAHNLQ